MFFKKKPPADEAVSAAVSAVAWELRIVTRELSELVPLLETKAIEPELIRARLADRYRDAQLEPATPAQFDRSVKGLDAEGWRRFALAVGALDHAEIRGVLPLLKSAPAKQLKSGFAAFAEANDLLTLTLLRQSEIRVEEFARQLANNLGIGWQGESAEQSRLRLDQLDYRRLLAEAELAKTEAEGRMEYLRKKQEEEANRRRPRGKQ